MSIEAFEIAFLENIVTEFRLYYRLSTNDLLYRTTDGRNEKRPFLQCIFFYGHSPLPSLRRKSLKAVEIHFFPQFPVFFFAQLTSERTNKLTFRALFMGIVVAAVCCFDPPEARRSKLASTLLLGWLSPLFSFSSRPNFRTKGFL